MNPLDSIHSSSMFIQHLNNPYFLITINNQNLDETSLSQFQSPVTDRIWQFIKH